MLLNDYRYLLQGLCQDLILYGFLAFMSYFQVTFFAGLVLLAVYTCLF